MIDSRKYEKIVYKKPNFRRKAATIDNIHGLDTEAYVNGKPFLACLDNGSTIDLENMPFSIYDPELDLENSNIGVYNLKYDSGALLYFLPKDTLRDLWRMQKCVYDGVTIEYIPHKYLCFAVGIRRKIRVWDIFQFYKMSLEKAASKYLGKHKTDIETKSFSEEYVRRHFREIYDYCVIDALLVKELMEFLIDKLSDFGIRTTALYSGASLSLRYYADKGNISTAWRYWKHYPEVLKAALDTYQGGKFEVTQRGYFNDVYEYDITSAYPYEIMNLYDVTGARIEHTKTYREEATYAFIQCTVDNMEGKHLPCGVKRENLRVYPAGVFTLWCTKSEYDYMTFELGLDVTIRDAYWLFVDFKFKIYKRTTEKIFALKKMYKNKDAMLYSVTKIMANSFYGKTVQVIEKPVTEEEEKQGVEIYEAGQGWNPILGTIITANTRLRVTRLQNEYNDDCIAVHTDSVILKRELDPEYITGKIGGFEFVARGPCILIACGQYELADKSAYKGFVPERIEKEGEYVYESWENILRRKPDGYVIKYPIRKTESWVEAVAKGHYDRINLFYDDTKVIDLNADIKRNWLSKMKAKNFLSGNQKSLPVMIVEAS